MNTWINELPPIGAAPTSRAYRITYHEGGRLISMSPALETIGDIAVAIHIQRAENPLPGEYRVWRIAQGGATARMIGNPPAYYPLTPLADIPADPTPGPMLAPFAFQS